MYTNWCVPCKLLDRNTFANKDVAKYIYKNFRPDLIDINYGCPVKKVAKKGAGAGILLDIPKMVRMTKKSE